MKLRISFFTYIGGCLTASLFFITTNILGPAEVSKNVGMADTCLPPSISSLTEMTNAASIINTGNQYAPEVKPVRSTPRKAPPREPELTITKNITEIKDSLQNLRTNTAVKYHLPPAPKGIHQIHNLPPKGPPKEPELTITKFNNITEIKYSLQKLRTNTTVTYHLPPKGIHRIHKFVVFMGDVRSGSSIIGTLLDAHPHVIVSDEYRLFNQFWELNHAPDNKWKENLFDMIYTRSKRDVTETGSRSSTGKGYQLKVNGEWQGAFDRWVEVIGDKSAGITIKSYLVDKEEFLRNYQKLKEKVSVPVLVINTLRNPFDIISTNMAILGWGYTKFRNLKKIFQEGKHIKKLNHSDILQEIINGYFVKLAPVQELTSIFGRENVLDVHNCDLVSNPRGTMSRIVDFLEVDATELYLDTCAEKIFKSESRTRNVVFWTPEQIVIVEKRMKEYEFLNRYNFTSE